MYTVQLYRSTPTFVSFNNQKGVSFKHERGVPFKNQKGVSFKNPKGVGMRRCIPHVLT